MELQGRQRGNTCFSVQFSIRPLQGRRESRRATPSYWHFPVPPALPPSSQLSAPAPSSAHLVARPAGTPAPAGRCRAGRAARCGRARPERGPLARRSHPDPALLIPPSGTPAVPPLLPPGRRRRRRRPARCLLCCSWRLRWQVLVRCRGRAALRAAGAPGQACGARRVQPACGVREGRRCDHRHARLSTSF